MEKRFISPIELSEYAGLKLDTIYSWIWQKKVPYHKMGRLVRFDLREIEEWIEGKRVKEMI